MMFFWLPVLILLPVGILWMLRSGTTSERYDMNRGGRETTPGAGPAADPVDIVRIRLARGEITTTQFEEIRGALG